ncbi:hypothetical protein FZC33_08330 [Labrys sp. KNU-23]|uniref:hypothetical protein n=1 Tax=Labrys sp. KNU-23 TaxID=2789216 RepID=UPI0011EBDF79|nr:hypothetical protein [Labrys sp. KNU-23]QEN86180.1 hypothetical protein FZC33_08330 [Labrys sp. KNU-23]
MTEGPFGDQKLNGPGITVGVSRRILGCETDIEPLYLLLVKAATEAGWSRAEIAIAVTHLADLSLIGKKCRNDNAELEGKGMFER